MSKRFLVENFLKAPEIPFAIDFELNATPASFHHSIFYVKRGMRANPLVEFNTPGYSFVVTTKKHKVQL